MEVLRENPFVVLTPDDVGTEAELEITNAELVHKLFVDVFEDFRSIPQQGHVFLNGPRGSGKSMMFRFLLPDCQLIHKNVRKYSDLPFFSIHIPIKLTSINNPEYEAVRDYGSSIFNEHVLTAYFAEMIFDSLSKLSYGAYPDHPGIVNEIVEYYDRVILKRFILCGAAVDTLPSFEPSSPSQAFDMLKDVCSEIFVSTMNFLKRSASKPQSQTEFTPYVGPLLDYLSFLFPILKGLKKLSIFPGKPIFLLVDDADNLSVCQVTVLNTWVSYRTNSEVSLKISTQLNYPTYNTISGSNITSPHDYYDVSILTTYSSSKDIYNKRIRQIVERRLDYFFGDNEHRVTAMEFFPTDPKQDSAIEMEKDLIRKEASEHGPVGYRTSDDIQRYAIPNYIRKLRRSQKDGPSFMYAGFDMLVSISSGIIRHFLTPASKMFNVQYRDLQLSNPNATQTQVRYIKPSIQSREIKDYSIKQLFDDFDKHKLDVVRQRKDPAFPSKITQLKNLIDGVGGLFGKYVCSSRSERKLFSFAISDRVEEPLHSVLELGVELGYFHRASIGKKSGAGRTRLFVMSRVLAPHFMLDPTSFAGYKFFTSEKLMRAIHNPDGFIAEMSDLRDDEEYATQAEFEFYYSNARTL